MTNVSHRSPLRRFALTPLVAAATIVGSMAFAACAFASSATGFGNSNGQQPRTDIEINGMSTDLDCEGLDVSYSRAFGEIFVKFNEPFEHASGEGYKKHCLVDFEIYVPENYRFATTNSALLGYVETFGDTHARVATSYRPIGKAGAVSTRTFGPGEERSFYMETKGQASAVDSRCGGHSMKLRLRVDLSLGDKRQLDSAATKQSILHIYSSTLRYSMTRCR